MGEYTKLENEVTRALNKMIAAEPAFRNLFPRTAGYRYWLSKNKTNKSRSQDKYFYTTSKVNHKGSQRFISGIYRFNASKKQWKATMKAGHAKKRDAMARAKKLYDLNK